MRENTKENTNKITRRQALKGLSSAGVLLASRVLSPSNGAILIAGRPVEIAVSSVSPRTLRLSLMALENGEPQPIPHDGALVRQIFPLARFRDLTGERSLRCGDMLVKFSPAPLEIRVQTADNRLVQHFRLDRQTGVLSFLSGDQPLLGLGEGGPQFDRRGSIYSTHSGQGGYRLRTHGARVPIQWLLGTGGWALFINQPYGAFDFSGREGRFDPRSESGDAVLPLDLFLVAAREPAQIMAEYARLTGHPEMPPLWSLGYMQSHRTLTGQEVVFDVARKFREKKLPCDALIYLGTGFAPSGWNTDNGEFAWNQAVFPNPPKIIDELHALHFKVVLHIVLEGRRLTGTVADRCTAEPLPSGRTPDKKWPEDRQVSCYWPFHKPLYDAGIDGWWPDQGDGLDAPSRLARIRMYYEGSQQFRPDERPFALHRNGHAGMQRFAAFLWSGDIYSTWETLKTHVPVALNTGLSGIPYWGTDIGGFVPTREYTGELHVRWFQFGAFCPLFRAHGRTWNLRLPWGWNTGELGVNEIANYTGGAANPDPSELHNPEVEPICRKYLELRYRLLPYLYSAVRETHETGLPIMRALWLHYPDDAAAVERGDQYLWGRDLLIAPVTEKGAQARQLYLPRGLWYDFWTEEKWEGGREIERPVDLSIMPIYARAGSIIPFGPLKMYTSEKVDGPLTLIIYPGADGAFTLYEDDGETFAYRRGAWMKVGLTWNEKRRRLTLRLAEGSRMLPPSRREIEIRVVPEKSARKVVFEGRPVEVSF